MFPLMGLFMFFIPVGGLLLAVFLCFIKRLRFLATFAFFVPLLGSYSAVAGFWAMGLWLERAGFHALWITLAALLGLLICGALGCAIGAVLAFGLNRLAVHIWRGLVKA